MNEMRGPWTPPAIEPSSVPPDLNFAQHVAGEVFFAVCLPPPVHGQSLVNASVVEAAREFAGADKVEVVDIGPGPNKAGLKYHLTRIARVAKAGFHLARRGPSPRRRFYTVFESGFGVVYNFFLIGLARLLGYAVVLHHHTSEHTFQRQSRFALLQKLAGPSCVNVVLSEEMAANLRLLYPRLGRVIVSQNACHIPTAPPVAAHAPRADRLRIGFLSNLCREKGLDVVLDVATQCRDRGLDVTFVFAGPTVGDEAAAMLAEGREKLGNTIEVVGPVRGEAKSAFFQSIDLFLFPTRYRYEAQPLVLLEAMSHGLFALTTNCGYVAELVGRQGAVFEPESHLAARIANEIAEIARRPERPSPSEIRAQFRRLQLKASGELRELLHVLHALPQSEPEFAPRARALAAALQGILAPYGPGTGRPPRAA